MKTGILVASISRLAGGLFYSTRKLCLNISKLDNVDLAVFSLRDDYSEVDFGCWGDIPVRLFSVHGPGFFGFTPVLRKVLRSARLDILHTHGLWMYPSIAALGCSRADKIPYLVSPRGMLDSWALRNSAWKKRIAGMLFENSHLKNAACIHALSLSEAESIRKYDLKNPICVIPNGVDLPLAASPKNNGLGKADKTLLYLGRLHPKKGLPNLLRAWAQARNDDRTSAREWKLSIVGWDQAGHELHLKKLANELAIDGSVLFEGPKFGVEKEKAYLNADAFILPSYSEGLPMAVLEAWSFGLPVLMTPQCNLSEGFHVGAGLRIELEVESILTGLETLFSMKQSELKAMGERGRALVKRRFDWSRIASEMKAVYEWVLDKGPKPDCVILA